MESAAKPTDALLASEHRMQTRSQTRGQQAPQTTSSAENSGDITYLFIFANMKSIGSREYLTTGTDHVVLTASVFDFAQHRMEQEAAAVSPGPLRARQLLRLLADAQPENRELRNLVRQALERIGGGGPDLQRIKALAGKNLAQDATSYDSEAQQAHDLVIQSRSEGKATHRPWPRFFEQWTEAKCAMWMTRYMQKWLREIIWDEERVADEMGGKKGEETSPISCRTISAQETQAQRPVVAAPKVTATTMFTGRLDTEADNNLATHYSQSKADLTLGEEQVGAAKTAIFTLPASTSVHMQQLKALPVRPFADSVREQLESDIDQGSAKSKDMANSETKEKRVQLGPHSGNPSEPQQNDLGQHSPERWSLEPQSQHRATWQPDYFEPKGPRSDTRDRRVGFLLTSAADGSEGYRYAYIERFWEKRRRVLVAINFSNLTPQEQREALAGISVDGVCNENLLAEAQRYSGWLGVVRHPDDDNPVPGWIRDAEQYRARRLGLPEPQYPKRVQGSFGMFKRVPAKDKES
ncbi:hypothetical protein M406DRAFT_76192 [Cryphonectria parasitica EP155]|uniref:Uncharacterized protein n=1 Tax=Cryphonectria parasitica (strain ATCC 38755 / EP155) TaxID=660469 RepID=A0A9P4XW90_CRYP1|nr:uncharacterized protein M406DRAFT_76192 [Cryphonectria parasitica EP155]KAF3762119.1 hypothetical protein M406DRAFT_76192 [Cryphonectria parasitica EP155]